MTRRPVRWAVPACLVALVAAACSSGSAAPASTRMTLYTCTSAQAEQAVVRAFEHRHEGAKVEVFRAPTGQLNARIAADVRSGGIKADVIWACDPLTMHGYDEQGLLAAWSPPNAADLPAAYRTPHYVGVGQLYMVIAAHRGVPAPATWADLARPEYRNRVAIPSPTFAASALGLLGYLSAAPGYGLDDYRRLKANGAVQVNAPGDVLSGVEQGRYRAGITLADAAYADQRKGSPIDVVWPGPGGVAIYAPIGVTTRHGRSSLATQFASFVASSDGQALLAKQGRYVVLTGVGGGRPPSGSPTVDPDWPSLFDGYTAVLQRYAGVFGG